MVTNDRTPDDELLNAARSARDRSYAPYSDFHMGAAVRCADGTIVPGALVENVSLGLAMCAERSALFATVARDLAPVHLVLASRRTGDELTFPCGACLQVALELAGPDLLVTAVDTDGHHATERLGDLVTRAPRRHTYRPAGTPTG